MRDAFVILAEEGTKSARSAAEAMTGPNREEALAGIAQAWAKSDLDGAIAWAKALPDGTDRDEIIRAALLGKAATDPVTALDRVGLVPPGGKQAYFASTTGARVLAEAVKAGYDATVAWIVAHPGRLSREDLAGMAGAVTERINADATGFLTRHAADGSLLTLMPAISSAILNDAAGQRAVMWDWLKTRPVDETSTALKQQVLSAVGYQDPAFALRLAADMPRTPDGDWQTQTLATSLLNGGSMLHRFQKLMEQAPERLRQPLIEAAFNSLHFDLSEDPRHWIERLAQLPEASRTRGTLSIARAWAERAPEDAGSWATSLTAGEPRSGAMAAVAFAWASKDTHGATEWVVSMPAGAERDGSVQQLVFAMAEKSPREAWDLVVSIGDAAQRTKAADYAARMMAARDPATAR